MNRRNFLTATVFAVTAWLIEACTSIKSTKTDFGVAFSLIDFPALQNIDGIAELTIQNNSLIAVRESQNNILVMSQKCSHRGCSLFTQSDGRGFECPCHGSSFDLKGNVTRGPALRSLEKRTVVFNVAAGTFQVD